jgi:hypothetical protein
VKLSTNKCESCPGRPAFGGPSALVVHVACYLDGGAVGERRVGAVAIIILPPAFELHSRILQREEAFHVQARIAEPAVERFAVAVLPGVPALDEQGPHAESGEPRPGNPGAELGAFVRAQVIRTAPGDAQFHEGRHPRKLGEALHLSPERMQDRIREGQLEAVKQHWGGNRDDPRSFASANGLSMKQRSGSWRTSY